VSAWLKSKIRESRLFPVLKQHYVMVGASDAVVLGRVVGVTSWAMCTAVHRVSSPVADHEPPVVRPTSRWPCVVRRSFVMYFTPARLDLINFAARRRHRRPSVRRSGAASAADRGRDMDGRPRQMNNQRSRRDMPPAARFICHLWHPTASPGRQTACSVQKQR